MSTSHHTELERLLVDNNIFPEGLQYRNGCFAPKPKDLGELLRYLSTSGIHERPGQDLTAQFRTLQQMNNTTSRSTIMRRVIPILEGSAGTDITNDGEVELDNLTPLVEGVEVVLQPDYFDGVPFNTINKQARDALGGLIIPSKHIGTPIAPNFFLEVRRPSGNAVTTKLEACYYGACGARSMHAIQNYGRDGTPKYDERPWSLSSTYVNGLLKIYAHFIVGPNGTSGALPGYHMVELKAFNMTSTYDDFIDGCVAFRNAREVANNMRYDLILDSRIMN